MDRAAGLAAAVSFSMDLPAKSLPCPVLRYAGPVDMAQNHDTELISLGRAFIHARRRYRRLRRTDVDDWAAWSAAMDNTTAVARRIGHVQPDSPAGLLVRYRALHWLLLEQDDAIMDDEGRRAFIAFGRALRRLVP